MVYQKVFSRFNFFRHSECSLHEVDQRHRQKRHNVTKSSIATRWSSNITRDLSPYRRRMNHTATPDRTRDALHEMSRYSAISARHERSSPRRNYSEVQDRPIRQSWLQILDLNVFSRCILHFVDKRKSTSIQYIAPIQDTEKKLDKSASWTKFSYSNPKKCSFLKSIFNNYQRRIDSLMSFLNSF